MAIPRMTLWVRWAKKVENVVNTVIGEDHGGVTVNKKGTVTIPWPTRKYIPISEFTTQYVFTLAFPALFPFGPGDFTLIGLEHLIM
jgi:hypothetical protein